MFDAAVIGGGVVGCAVLRALALAGVPAVLLERGADILSGASKGNSALLHTGFDAPTGSLELACMRAGYRAYMTVRERLNLPVLETSALVVAWSEAEAARLPSIVDKAHANGVLDVRPIALPELHAREPHLAPGAVAALLVPGEHVLDPWSPPLAYALQALANGARIRRRAAVQGGTRAGNHWRLETEAGPILARTVINCAGTHGDIIERIAREPPFRIRPRKGQFVVFDKPAARLLGSILLPVPGEHSKGVLMARTAFGNLLVGPTAEDQDDRDLATVEREALQALIARARALVPALEGARVTATYAGLRPATERKDYVIEALPGRGWITVAGIRSTGLTAALGIAEHVLGLFREVAGPPPGRSDIVWTPVPNLAEHLPRPYRDGGEIVCHCELVTRGEIERALEGPLPAGDLGGLRRRTRCMLGRCQGFYCSAAIAAIAAGRLDDLPCERVAA